MTEEIWKDITGYEGLYKVSNLGRVKSLRNNIILKPGNSSGYLRVNLCKNGKRKYATVHRLVAEAFIENENDLPQVNHIDEVKTNNKVSNLEWCTAKYNSNYGTHIKRILKTRLIRNTKTAEKEVEQFTKNGKFVNSYISISEAERQTQVCHNHISACCKGKRQTAGGYIWKYKNND